MICRAGSASRSLSDISGRRAAALCPLARGLGSALVAKALQSNEKIAPDQTIASLPTRLERAEREIADFTRLAKQLDMLVAPVIDHDGNF
jgi:hypothetical protein